jgi:hypothetical protein
VHDVITTAEAVTGRLVPRRHAAAAHEPEILLYDSTRIRTELGSAGLATREVEPPRDHRGRLTALTSE